MTYFPEIGVYAINSPSLDAFDRWRVSSPETLFDAQQQYGDNALAWETQTAGTGTTTFLPNEATIQMSTGGAAAGASVIRQTKTMFRYQPGKSQLIVCTFLFGAGAVNVRRRVGYFNAQNGVFLEQTSAGVSIVLRSFVTGAVVDDVVPQASWNLNTLPGLDITKVQILLIDLQWLGVGRVRVGFVLDGGVTYVHEFLNANTTKTAVYMTTANLPIRYEITNTGAAAGATTLKHICGSVMSEGGQQTARTYPFVASNGITAIAVTTRRPILSVRAKTTGPNAVRNTGQILMRSVDISAATNSCYFELVLNGTLGGVPVWTAVNAAASVAEFDVAATTIAGGTVIDAGFGLAGGGTVRGAGGSEVFGNIPLVYSDLLSVQDTLSLVCTSFTGTSNVAGMLAWNELAL